MNPHPAGQQATQSSKHRSTPAPLSKTTQNIRSLLPWRKMSTLNLIATFRQFSPYSRGNYHKKAELTVQAINETFPLMSALASDLNKSRFEPVNIATATDCETAVNSANHLETLLKAYGSDKAHPHNYHLLYGAILKDRPNIKAVLEVGLGTHNKDVISNMGAAGHPGASLRAFRDHLPNAKIYGADIDKRILFTEERIETFWCDQTSCESFHQLDKDLPDDLDLVIDDGLHSPHANLRTLTFGLKKIRPGGWMVVEDIHPDALPVWQTIAALFHSNTSYKTTIYRSPKAIIFAVQKLS